MTSNLNSSIPIEISSNSCKLPRHRVYLGLVFWGDCAPQDIDLNVRSQDIPRCKTTPIMQPRGYLDLKFKSQMALQSLSVIWNLDFGIVPYQMRTIFEHVG